MSRRRKAPGNTGAFSQDAPGSWANRTLAYLAWCRSNEERLRWKADCMRANGGKLSADEQREDERRRAREAEMFARAFPEKSV